MFDRTMRRLKFGWSMAGSSIAVVRRQPKLLVFPLLSGLALAGLFYLVYTQAIVSFLRHGAHSPMVRSFVETGEMSLGLEVTLYACAAALYFSVWFIAIFFNSALVFSVLRFFETGRVSLREGLSMACYRLPQILGWALVASTIGIMLAMLTSMLKDRLGFLGQFLGGLLEVAWAALTYFVTPALVVEGLGPIQAVRRSHAILKQSWGETAGGEFGLGIVWLLLSLPLFPIWLAASAGFGPAGSAILVYLAVPYCIGLVILMSTLSTVLCAALYTFATKGEPPAGFEPGAMAGAFRPRR